MPGRPTSIKISEVKSLRSGRTANDERKRTEKQFEMFSNFIDSDIRSIEEELGGTLCSNDDCNENCQFCGGEGIKWWPGEQTNTALKNTEREWEQKIGFIESDLIAIQMNHSK